jgi:ribose transport system permease protein
MSWTLPGVLRRNPYLFTLALLVLAMFANYSFQENFFELRVVNGTLRGLLPTMLLTVGQAIVIIGGGIDLSVGTMVSMINAVLVTSISADSTPEQIAGAILLAVVVGVVAGGFNGFCVAFLRLQPIVTTYATSFIFSGIALEVLPRPGGNIPRDLSNAYRQPLFEIPVAVYVIAVVLLLWFILRSTRYGQFLFAVGGKSEAAYTTGVPVTFVKFSTYVWAGFFAAMAALALTLLTGSGDPRLGDGMTLTTIVAVVLGGTRLSGGQGGIFGPIMGVALLTLVSNIISFANISTWFQDLANALIIIVALAGPETLRMLRRIIRR